jgi:hypothetical protein
MSVVMSFVAAIAVARYVWLHSTAAGAGFVRSTMMGALVTGAVGFSAGFFGPMIFSPSANQGPLLGIFITGPLGLIFGGAGGANPLVRARGVTLPPRTTGFLRPLKRNGRVERISV